MNPILLRYFKNIIEYLRSIQLRFIIIAFCLFIFFQNLYGVYNNNGVKDMVTVNLIFLMFSLFLLLVQKDKCFRIIFIMMALLSLSIIYYMDRLKDPLTCNLISMLICLFSLQLLKIYPEKRERSRIIHDLNFFQKFGKARSIQRIKG